MSRDAEQIRTLFSTWQKATLEGDSETLERLMAEDVVFLTAEFEPMVGRNAFLEIAQAAPRPFRIDFDGELKELEIFGDWAYAWNRLAVTIIPVQGAEPIRRSGNILTILHKENGAWVLKRDANMLTMRG